MRSNWSRNESSNSLQPAFRNTLSSIPYLAFISPSSLVPGSPGQSFQSSAPRISFLIRCTMFNVGCSTFSPPPCLHALLSCILNPASTHSFNPLCHQVPQSPNHLVTQSPSLPVMFSGIPPSLKFRRTGWYLEPGIQFFVSSSPSLQVSQSSILYPLSPIPAFLNHQISFLGIWFHAS